MKIVESGMPEEELWNTFFDAESILSQLALKPDVQRLVEFGCGYGTFTIPAARRVQGTVHAIDIDPGMVSLTAAKAAGAGLLNVQAFVRDFVRQGTGLPDETADYAMLFNILHAESPLVLVREAWRVLRRGGILGVIHWNHDPSTPRGPSMEIRPKPQQCQAWAMQVGFELQAPGLLDLPPFHYGMALEKPL
jgi:SAM-dependent methyltransferase